MQLSVNVHEWGEADVSALASLHHLTLLYSVPKSYLEPAPSLNLLLHLSKHAEFARRLRHLALRAYESNTDMLVKTFIHPESRLETLGVAHVRGNHFTTGGNIQRSRQFSLVI